MGLLPRMFASFAQAFRYNANNKPLIPPQLFTKEKFRKPWTRYPPPSSQIPRSTASDFPPSIKISLPPIHPPSHPFFQIVYTLHAIPIAVASGLGSGPHGQSRHLHLVAHRLRSCAVHGAIPDLEFGSHPADWWVPKPPLSPLPPEYKSFLSFFFFYPHVGVRYIGLQMRGGVPLMCAGNSIHTRAHQYL